MSLAKRLLWVHSARVLDRLMYILGRNLSFDWKAWLGWILATLVGIELCVLCLYPPVRYGLIDESPAIGIPAILASAGTILGTAQWFWLRRRSTVGAWWIAATIGGWLLAWSGGFLLTVVLNRIAVGGSKGKAFINSPFADILIYSLSSVLIALPQFFLLRRHVSRSGWWIAARPLSWLAGVALAYVAEEWNVVESGLFEPERIFGFVVPEIVGWCALFLFFGTGFAAITGAAMVLLQQNCPFGPAPPDTQRGRS